MISSLPAHAQAFIIALTLALLLIQTARAAYFRGRYEGARHVGTNLAEEIDYLRAQIKARAAVRLPLTARLECIAQNIAPPSTSEAVAIIHEAQSILARYLPPDGINEQQTINELLGLLDAPAANALTHHLRS
jgi:hypothetical protein